MLNNLALVMKVHATYRELEFVVSRHVMQEILATPNRGIVWMQLNIPQEGLRYPFLSRIQWRGLTFIHPSRDPICLDLEPAGAIS